jgi:CRP-like cAMP-binding protein
MKCLLLNHPQRNSIRLQLQRHPLLAGLDDEAHEELMRWVTVQEGHRGEVLLEQGERELCQFFVLDGLLKRIVASAEGREMALRFVGADDIESCYEAWQQRMCAAYSIVCATHSTRVASLPMGAWCDFLARQPRVQQAFHERIVQIGAAIVEHAVALLLLDAPSRVHRFSGRHPELVDQLPQKDLAAHLNLSAETLCRLSRRRAKAAVYCPG